MQWGHLASFSKKKGSSKSALNPKADAKVPQRSFAKNNAKKSMTPATSMSCRSNDGFKV
jgi:hypothetical protein